MIYLVIIEPKEAKILVILTPIQNKFGKKFFGISGFVPRQTALARNDLLAGASFVV